MGVSRLDIFYRKLLLTKLFFGGWGKPEDLKRIFEFRKIIGDRERGKSLVPDDYPVCIDKTEDYIDCQIHDGFFISPLEHLVPGILPPEAIEARFQFIVPKKWQRNRPVCIQLAGTGDHEVQSEERIRPACDGRSFDPGVQCSSPLAREGRILATRNDWHLYGWIYGVSGSDQLAEAHPSYSLSVMVHCIQCLHQGNKKGVLSKAVSWPELEKQYAINSVYEEEIFELLEYCGDDSFKMGQQQFKRSPDGLGSLNRLLGLSASSAEQYFKTGGDAEAAQALLTAGGQGAGQHGARVWPPVSAGNRGHSVLNTRPRFRDSETVCGTSCQKEPVSFMKGVLDECTHMANFSVPVDTSLIIVIQAREDAYVPRAGVVSLQEIWPGCEVRYLNGGHISAYLFKQKVFRQAIYDAFDRFCQKYSKLHSSHLCHHEPSAAEEREKK
ncbi:protein ABHD18 isoform X1 [Thalassophryne amazonica]|uniref:protein ABHD18 isoform X1 n=1 Tax=Thalassophryne amazonica TaxID=390379 RepID=UPI00147149FC|nr:protein ABHD18 isoform X1 [Thalassophryne amazonica]